MEVQSSQEVKVHSRSRGSNPSREAGQKGVRNILFKLSSCPVSTRSVAMVQKNIPLYPDPFMKAL